MPKLAQKKKIKPIVKINELVLFTFDVFSKQLSNASDEFPQLRERLYAIRVLTNETSKLIPSTTIKLNKISSPRKVVNILQGQILLDRICNEMSYVVKDCWAYLPPSSRRDIEIKAYRVYDWLDLRGRKPANSAQKFFFSVFDAEGGFLPLRSPKDGLRQGLIDIIEGRTHN